MPNLIIQRFIVGKKFVVKKVILRRETVLSHIFTRPMPWNFSTKSKKCCWLNAYHHELQWKDG